MTSDRNKCGLSSLLPMSCRGRAEAFARRLHTRLRSLGSQDGNGAADENSWLGAHESSLALSQPRHSTDTDVYFDFGVLESPGSPEEELDRSELERLINQDNLKLSHSDDCHCSTVKGKSIPLLKSVTTTSNDSDSSDGPFFDTENEPEPKKTQCNGISHLVNGDSNSVDYPDSKIVEVDSNEYSTEEIYSTPSESTLPPCSSSLSEDASTLSLRDDDYPSLEISSPLSEIPQCDDVIIESVNHETDKDCENDSDKETYRSSLIVDKDLTIECPNSIVIIVPDRESPKTEAPEIEESKSSLNIVDDDDDDSDDRTPRVRRCSSLKTGKTPPGTPGRKKIVRFADVLGLDLADVRTFLDEIPKVPNSAYEDLKNADLGDSESDNSLSLGGAAAKFHGIAVDRVLVPLFQQPGGQPNFLDRVRDNFVCLENAVVDDPLTLSIKGSVRVRNLDFHKSVHIRYSLDSWQTYADLQAVYSENSCDGFSDTFTFLMYAHTLTVGQRIEFAVRFQCKGCQYWDSNNGANYCFQCLPATNTTSYMPIMGVDDSWGASFYYQEDSSDEADVEVLLTPTIVQELITHSLGKKRERPKEKYDMMTIFAILLFSILFMYLPRAIFSAK